MRNLGDSNCQTVNCPLGQAATAESGWTCQVQESEYPVYYTPETASGACYYPINHVDKRNRGLAASHKYYVTDQYSNHFNCRFSIKPWHFGEWRWQIIFLDIESGGSTCRYDKFQEVGGSYYCNSANSNQVGRWNNENGQVSFQFTTDYSVTENGFKFVFEPIKPQVELTNARFAYYDASQTRGEGASVASYTGWEVAKAIDGNYGQGDTDDHAAHPTSSGSGYSAHFFVDLNEHVDVDYVTVWPRRDDRGYNNGYYEGLELYVGSISCTSDQVYTQDVIENTLYPNVAPLIFRCNSVTTSKTIRLARGSNGPVQLAEIEVFTNAKPKIALTNPRFAYYDANGEGASVAAWTGHDVSKAIDGNYGLGGDDNVAHSSDKPAHFFVDLVNPTVVNYVTIFPRARHQYYENMEVYADSVLCTANQSQARTNVVNNIIRYEQAMVFTCPSGTSASTIRVTPDTNRYVQCSEIEVFGN